LPDYFIAEQNGGNLDIFGFGINAADRVNFRFINMPVRKMIEQIIKRKNVQLFFQQIGSLGTDSFQVFYRI
jgi:hypothetical protein